MHSKATHVVKTTRLDIIPLDLELLYLSCVDYGKVQSALDANVTRQTHDPEIVYALKEAHYRASGDLKNIHWYTNWEMFDRQLHIIVGSVCFKGPPDETGSVEIGYEVYGAYENLGYASEATNALVRWALDFGTVHKIVASVEPDNAPSKRVLTKLGMKLYDRSEGLEWWGMDK